MSFRARKSWRILTYDKFHYPYRRTPFPSKLYLLTCLCCRLLPVSDLSEKERFLTSVINALSKDESLALSACMAQALILRAQVYSSTGESDKARADALGSAALDPYHPTVWRILATVEEERNDPVAAIQALSNWATYQPHFSTKVQNEISRLQTNGAIPT